MKPRTFVLEHKPNAVCEKLHIEPTPRHIILVNGDIYAIGEKKGEAWAAAQRRVEIELQVGDTAIFDLDGTLAIIDDRREFCRTRSGDINFEKFYDPENIKLDKPNWPVITMLKLLRAAGKRIVIFSGRSQATEEATIKFLKSCGVKYDMLIMRPNDEDHIYTTDSQLKATWLRTYFPEDDINRILCVYDDRDKVVNMWRKHGIPCFQVNDGEF